MKTRESEFQTKIVHCKECMYKMTPVCPVMMAPEYQNKQDFFCALGRRKPNERVQSAINEIMSLVDLLSALGAQPNAVLVSRQMADLLQSDYAHPLRENYIGTLRGMRIFVDDDKVGCSFEVGQADRFAELLATKKRLRERTQYDKEDD